jgi:hypothetical protein
MPDTMDAVKNMFDQDYNEFKNNVSDILFNKLQDRISVERIAVGQSMFQDDYDIDEDEVQQQDDTDFDPELELENNEDDSDEEV